MTSFENMLIDKGYLMFYLNCKTMKLEPENKGYRISKMLNLDYRYIHKDDKVILDKIEQGKSVMDDDFTWEDRKGVICFGLREKGKPPTLIRPRPKIIVKRNCPVNWDVIIEDEFFDNSMNLVLMREKPEQIFKAMYDDSIVFEFDLT